MADGSITFEFVDEYDFVVDDLSVWEFINPSSSEDEEEGDSEDFPLTEEDATDEVFTESKEEGPLEFGSLSSDISMESLSAPLPQPNDGGAGIAVTEVGNDEDDDDYGSNDEDDDYDDYDDGYDLDDELVPWGLSDKFGRQRIRKLGKRACPKMNKAKRLPYRYNRPGCVHGKHGFGVQHSYI